MLVPFTEYPGIPRVVVTVILLTFSVLLFLEMNGNFLTMRIVSYHKVPHCWSGGHGVSRNNDKNKANKHITKLNKRNPLKSMIYIFLLL